MPLIEDQAGDPELVPTISPGVPILWSPLASCKWLKGSKISQRDHAKGADGIDRLVSLKAIDPGAVFIGKVAANSAVNDVLELSGTTAATLSTEFSGFSSFTEDAGADWTLTGENSFDGEVAIGGVLQEADALVSTLRMSGPGAYLSNQGTITGGFAASGVYLMGGTLLNDGTIAAAGGVGASAVEFGGPATLAFGRNAVFDGAITGFGSGDTLVAENKVLTSDTYVSGTGLELSGAGGTATIDLIGNFGADTFLLSNNGTSTSIGLDTTGEIYTITGVVKVGVTPGEGRYTARSPSPARSRPTPMGSMPSAAPLAASTC